MGKIFMQDSVDNHCREFAKCIRDVFQGGLHISNKDSHFILSTLPIAHLNEVDKLIQDPDSSEYDELMELMYFPDESIQIRLEDRIESARFQPHDVDTILTQLISMETDTRIALGLREPHDDKKVLMQKVVFLDEIGLALYDRNI